MFQKLFSDLGGVGLVHTMPMYFIKSQTKLVSWRLCETDRQSPAVGTKVQIITLMACLSTFGRVKNKFSV